MLCLPRLFFASLEDLLLIATKRELCRSTGTEEEEAITAAAMTTVAGVDTAGAADTAGEVEVTAAEEGTGAGLVATAWERSVLTSISSTGIFPSAWMSGNKLGKCFAIVACHGWGRRILSGNRQMFFSYRCRRNTSLVS